MKTPSQRTIECMERLSDSPLRKHNAACVNPKRIGEVVRRAREAAGLTQRELGDMLGLQRNHVSRFECAACVPGLLTIERFCTAVGIRVSELFKESDREEE